LLGSHVDNFGIYVLYRYISTDLVLPSSHVMQWDLRDDGSRHEYHSHSLILYSFQMRFSFYIYCIFTELVVWLWRLSWHAHESDLAHRRRKTVCVMHVCSSFTTWSRRSDMFGLRPISSIKNKLDPLDLSYCEVAHIFHFFFT
jgi:hypothetical protein